MCQRSVLPREDVEAAVLLEDIPYTKVPRRLPPILTVEEMTRLIDAGRTLTDPRC